MKPTLKRETIGKLFVTPYILSLLVFFAYPVGFAFYLLFYRWDLITDPEFIGLRNIRFLLHDIEFWKSLFNTVVFLVIHIPLQIVCALGIAWILSRPLAGRGIFRSVFFLPVVISGAVVTIMWQQLYATDTGMLNHYITLLGFQPVPWLTNPHFAMPAIAIMATWKNVGLYIILFLSGILSIPAHLYEAAKMEGATPWQEFWRITLPLLRPTMLLVVVFSTLGGFNLFIEPYVMTQGGPMGSTLSVVLYMYKHAFDFQHMGYAATIGVALTLIILVFVFVQKKFLDTESYF